MHREIIMDYIIVQAGGKGTRLGHLTKNKPKALVPVENLPMLFHLFRKYPDKKFVVIADYKKEVMREYLEAFAEVKYQVVDADGTGTCAGIGQAIDLIPEQEPFMLVWSDLILPVGYELPAEYTEHKAKDDYIGISQTFLCRWSYRDEMFNEECSSEHGVAGFFLFTEKSKLADVPQSGELVRWMQEKQMIFRETGLAGTREFGLLEEYEKLENTKCRPFNKITVQDHILIKEAVDKQGEILAQRECRWYEKAKRLNISALPIIYGTNPLQMEFVDGKNIYECDYGEKWKEKTLEKLIQALHMLHNSETVASDSFSIKEAYYNKTFARLSKIQELIPFAKERELIINGRKCRNVYYYKQQLAKKIEKLQCDKFAFIHGDCTFSNMMIRNDGELVLIDPRGYFGYSELFGDIRYDWAKIYYSIVGNYDQFNLKKFQLDIGANLDEGIKLRIESNHWEDMEQRFFDLTNADPYEIKLLHAVIWLSLTTYAWQDYDSVCGAFYNGLYYLEEVL